MSEVTEKIKSEDGASRVLTKGSVGYVIEEGYFGIKKNSEGQPDIPHLGVEIKTCPLKYNSTRTKVTVKEPLSLNIINYCEEYKNKTLKDSSIYKKNKTTLFICYIHDYEKERSDYLIKYVFLWNIDNGVLSELEPDYQEIIKMIKLGKAHEIHQTQHKYLTICPKHNGTFKDPNCTHSKRKQPFSDAPAEIRAFRLKNKYVARIITSSIHKELDSSYYWVP